jgi:hypothetical protein
LRKLKLLGGLLAGLVILLVVGSFVLFRPGPIAAELAQEIGRATGMTLKIAAPAEISLWPEPALLLNKVSLEHTGSAATSPLSADKLVIRTSLKSLLSGSLAPISVEAEGARFNLLVDSKGGANWPGTLGLLPLPVKVSNGTVTYLDERSGSTFVAGEVNGTIAPQDTGEGLRSYGEMVWRQQPVRFTMQLKSLERLFQDGSPLSMTANGPLVDFFFDGRAGLAQGLSLAGQVSINSDNLRALARWLGYDMKSGSGPGSFMLSGALDSAGTRVRISRATMALDATSASGTLGLDLGGRVPLISGNLVADEIDLAAYFGEPRKPGTDWSDDPISLAELKSVNAEVDLAVELATYGDLELREIKTRIEQRDGMFTAWIPEVSVSGGSATATIRLDATTPSPAVSIDFAGRQIEARGLLSSLFGLSVLNGWADVSANLNATGNSQAEMISTLTGSASIDMANGRFERIDPGALLTRVSSEIVEGWQSEGSTPFNDLHASFSIADGVATISQLSYSGSSLSLRMSGEADVLRRTVNLRAEPSYVDPSGASTAWPVQIAVTGPWAKPKIFADIAELPGDPDKGFQKLRNMGLPALVSPQAN